MVPEAKGSVNGGRVQGSRLLAGRALPPSRGTSAVARYACLPRDAVGTARRPTYHGTTGARAWGGPMASAALDARGRATRDGPRSCAGLHTRSTAPMLRAR